ncbi:hypothetical protein [Legionella worsleiensis]|uniref:Uncharacterized protein n=1 Tax=Legionella worsleiensis TaxID=45076 RepID=A0A0W1AJR9_9GAMM|nr:hypothetical protein [Legionella worsleiensis]KTD81585.1 hypothetical protein Lwor_0623 [Legionella worsleiensis]STY32145.1 Periplasmic glucans biosynthesis protein [Legionella worsleiensis]
MKTTSRTEKKYHAFDSSPRCVARTKGNNGIPCRCPGMTGKNHCLIHGCAKGSGAPRCSANALKHGRTTAQVKAFRIKIRGII